ncbi:2-oxo-4-hydroxy-4-carboxy-5-ureidoimidazoline decarboxylase [Rhodococcus sp. GA1]|uniref:2-oxo-4-hydroxy-4-carboxy-5-ureidoimidazoline decarboxylase n=1 Tax=Rhodococcus sp. GA1 TaxID=2942275 RepID=UPI0020CC2D15|nr:2-oxo-4-hydroxy-4-carboxy-5-ureidoimidazoline decarboxylase [Rhodococcus sp. GA1]
MSAHELPIDRYDAMAEPEAIAAVRSCVDIPSFGTLLAQGRPYRTTEALLMQAESLTRGWTDHEVERALAGHPRIGERTDNARSRAEQAGVASDDETSRRLHSGNVRYEARFGRIYLVRAKGRSAEELLAILEQRLQNDDSTEWQVTREQLAEITLLRLKELMSA